MNQILPVEVIGHVKITDDLGEVLLDHNNSIHPQNVARVIARALANEPNHHIHAIAFGNGGTITDAAYQITYKTPNDGQSPDTSDWRSGLYNETYREVVDESSTNIIGTGVGSSAGNDPASSLISGPGVRSSELGLVSQIKVESVLNPYEPSGQAATDILSPTEYTEDAFTFDELGLFTTGSPLRATNGYQDVNVGGKTDTSITGLSAGTTYRFNITVNGSLQTITFSIGSGSGAGGEVTYGDLIIALNSRLVGCAVTISDANGFINTYGHLRFTSAATGSSSSVVITEPTPIPSDWLFNNLIDYNTLNTPSVGSEQGTKNNPANPTNEGERMLSHLIFSPIRKSSNRTLTIIYTLTVQVARSTS